MYDHLAHGLIEQRLRQLRCAKHEPRRAIEVDADKLRPRPLPSAARQQQRRSKLPHSRRQRPAAARQAHRTRVLSGGAHRIAARLAGHGPGTSAGSLHQYGSACRHAARPRRAEPAFKANQRAPSTRPASSAPCACDCGASQCALLPTAVTSTAGALAYTPYNCAQVARLGPELRVIHTAGGAF